MQQLSLVKITQYNVNLLKFGNKTKFQVLSKKVFTVPQKLIEFYAKLNTEMFHFQLDHVPSLTTNKSATQTTEKNMAA